MADRGTETSPRRWVDIARLTLVGTAAAVGASLVLTYLLFFSEALTPLARSLVLATVLPILVAVPLLVFIGLKLQELRAQQQRLNRLTTYDQTTGLMNGMVLAAIVERRVHATDVEDPARGGFLVVRLDNLFDINVKHGFGWGDEALRVVAVAIRAAIRQGDTVGRLGASEFGVFLPGASAENAHQVGERIRAEIAKTSFTPAGAEMELAISTGGVVFEQDFRFGDMFRSAEQQLAQQQSRGGLALARVTDQRSDTIRH